MGVGLGKNSPVVLSLGKENYEALITRHGQWVRWRQATICNCVEDNTLQPDIHCKKCGGRGYIYTHQKTMETWQNVLITDTTGIIELPEDCEESKLIKVYKFDGTEYKEATKHGKYIMLNSEDLPEKSSYLNIILEKPLEKTIETTAVEKIGNGYYILPELSITRTGIDGIYYRAPCDILDLNIEDENGEKYKAIELRQNKFYIEPNKEIDEEGKEVIKPIGVKITVSNITYIEPFIFVILSQNLSNKDSEDVIEAKGDAVVSFPYSCNVAQKDILTVLAGTYTNKEVVKRQLNDVDTLGAYFIDKVVSITGDREYKEGIDFILLGNNKIKWLGKNTPKVGHNYSIVYNAFPTYVVMKDIPQLRTSENQRIPKKAVIKFVSTYSEMTKINRQK